MPVWFRPNSAGLINGTSALRAPAPSAISSLSVETMQRSIAGQSLASRVEWAISGRPASGRMFLPGKPFDPPRSSMTASNGRKLKPASNRRAHFFVWRSGDALRWSVRRPHRRSQSRTYPEIRTSRRSLRPFVRGSSGRSKVRFARLEFPARKLSECCLSHQSCMPMALSLGFSICSESRSRVPSSQPPRRNLLSTAALLSKSMQTLSKCRSVRL